MKTCQASECSKPIRTKNLCQGHYKRLLEGRDLTTPIRDLDPSRICKYPNCKKTHWGKGYCQYHHRVVIRGHGEEGFKIRPCDHCQESYKPAAHNSRWCRNCVPNPSARSRMQNFNLSQPEYDLMYSEVKGLCPLCGTREATCVDHCHKTEIVRGLLCKRCNTVLHEVEDSEWLVKARRYLNAQVGDQRPPQSDCGGSRNSSQCPE